MVFETLSLCFAGARSGGFVGASETHFALGGVCTMCLSVSFGANIRDSFSFSHLSAANIGFVVVAVRDCTAFQGPLSPSPALPSNQPRDDSTCVKNSTLVHFWIRKKKILNKTTKGTEENYRVDKVLLEETKSRPLCACDSCCACNFAFRQFMLVLLIHSSKAQGGRRFRLGK